MNIDASYEKFLEILLENESRVRDDNGIKRRIKLAKLPYSKYLHDIEYEVFSKNVSNQIRELTSLSFIDEGRNVILVGNPGVGKTHIAIGLGIAAHIKHKNVLYITVQNLITELEKSISLNQLTRYKNKLEKYDLVILDELGYIEIDREGSQSLFKLLSIRNET